MSNKNVADYTNFDGKTNKRIVQAPGGSSSMSLAWSNEKTDYGPERHHKKKDPYSGQNEQPSKPYLHQQNDYSANQPIRVMESYEDYSRMEPANYQKLPVYSQPPFQAPRIGGEHGYSQYAPPPQYGKPSYQEPVYPPRQSYQEVLKNPPVYQEYQGYQKPMKPYVPETLDMAVEQHKKLKEVPPPPQMNRMSQQSRETQQLAQRPCVKIHDQKSSISLGDASYNYWKDTGNERKPNQPMPQKQYEPVYQQQPYAEKTSVRVKNPPGGKGSFVLG